MKGLKLARDYYEAYGKKLIEEDFNDIKDELCACLIGSGSECYGYDDEISKDHDFEPGFLLFVSDRVDDDKLFELERAYNKLPKEFMGYKRNLLAPIGIKRKGVIRLSDYLLDNLGRKDSKLNIQEWLTIPEYIFSQLTNGEIFYDPSALVSNLRNDLLNMPEDVLLKRMAGALLVMGQSGQYNYERLIKRNEKASAQLAINEFVKASIRIIFLLNRSYMPFYKWQFKALRQLNIDNITLEMLEHLLCSSNDDEEVNIKIEMIDKISKYVINTLKIQCFSDLDNNDLEKQAYHLNDKIKDINVRNLDILVSI